MDTTSVGGLGSSAALSQAVGSNAKLGQQEFLKLLITQLTNQDPLSPEDDKEFLAQMAQFSSVEGITNINTSLDNTQAASLLGKTVDAQITTNGMPVAVSGVVTAVQYATDGPHLQVNGQDITMSQVVQIRQQ